MPFPHLFKHSKDATRTVPEEKTGDLSPRHRGPGAGRGRRPGEGVPGASGGAAGGPPGQPPQGPRRRKTPYTPLLWSAPLPSLPGIFKVTCQSPTPVSFLAQVGQPRGEGRRKAPAILTPHHLGSGAPKAFGSRSGCPSTFRCPGASKSGCWSPWEEARPGWRGGLGRTECLGRWVGVACPQLPSSCLFCFFFF